MCTGHDNSSPAIESQRRTVGQDQWLKLGIDLSIDTVLLSRHQLRASTARRAAQARPTSAAESSPFRHGNDVTQ